MQNQVPKQIIILILLSSVLVLILIKFVNVQPKKSIDITNEFKMRVVQTDQAKKEIRQIIQDVNSGNLLQDEFKKINTSGFYDISETIVLKAKIGPNIQSPEPSLIEIPDTILAYIDIWIISSNLESHHQSGMRQAVSTRQFFDNSNVFQIPEANEEITVIIAISTDGPLELKLLKWDKNNWLESQSKEKVLYGLFLGFMLILIIYNILHAIYLKTYSYYYYCIYLTGQTIIVITSSGLTKLLLWPNIGFLDTQVMYISMAISTCFGLGFCISFLKIKRFSTSFYYLGIILIFTTILTSILNLMSIYSALMMQIYYSINLVALIYYLVLPLYIFTRGREYAKYLFYGFGLFSVTLIYSISKTIGFIENNAPTQEILTVGILVESLFLSIALYERIRNIKNRQEFAEKKLRIANANFVTTLLSNQEKDRTEISAFLHDAIGHDALILKQRINSGNKDKNETLEHLNNLIDKVRNLSIHIHPHVLSNIGLIPAIKQLVHNALRYSEIEYVLDLNIDERKISSNISISVYRIIQEALNNILKYANSSEVFIRLIDSGDILLGEIKDDGIGLIDEKVTNSGSGLTIMRGRIKILGGSLEIKSELRQGTKISFEIPYIVMEEKL